MKNEAEDETTEASAWDSPDGLDLEPRHPQVVRVSRRTSLALIALVLVLLGLFAYGGWRRRQRQIESSADSGAPKRAAPATSAGADIEKDVPAGNIAAVRQPMPVSAKPGDLIPPEDLQTPNIHRTAPTEAYPSQVAQPYASAPNQVQQAKEPTPEERRSQAAYEAEQRALAAPTSIGNLTAASTWAAPTPGGTVKAADVVSERQLEQRTQPEDHEIYDNKADFLARARSASNSDYLKSTRAEPLAKFEIKAGWEIPAVMEQALNSDLPGELKALVTSNVYDTASGRYVLIPQGSRLVGEYNSQLGYGQDGVQVVWNRVIYPDASSLNLNGMIGQDMAGFSGFRDKIDRHYKRLVGFAVLTSMFSAASAIAQNRNRSVLTYPNPGDVAASSVGQQVSDLGSQITRRNLSVQPTIMIPVGYRFNVRVNRDVLFQEPYLAPN